MSYYKIIMKIVTIREIQHHLPKMLEMVAAGEEVVITRRGKRVAKIERYCEAEESSVVIPDFSQLREDMGTHIIRCEGENEVIRQRGEVREQ